MEECDWELASPESHGLGAEEWSSKKNTTNKKQKNPPAMLSSGKEMKVGVAGGVGVEGGRCTTMIVF